MSCGICRWRGVLVKVTVGARRLEFPWAGPQGARGRGRHGTGRCSRHLQLHVLRHLPHHHWYGTVLYCTVLCCTVLYCIVTLQCHHAVQLHLCTYPASLPLVRHCHSALWMCIMLYHHTMNTIYRTSLAGTFCTAFSLSLYSARVLSITCSAAARRPFQGSPHGQAPRDPRCSCGVPSLSQATCWPGALSGTGQINPGLLVRAAGGVEAWCTSRPFLVGLTTLVFVLPSPSWGASTLYSTPPRPPWCRPRASVAFLVVLAALRGAQGQLRPPRLLPAVESLESAMAVTATIPVRHNVTRHNITMSQSSEEIQKKSPVHSQLSGEQYSSNLPATEGHGKGEHAVHYSVPMRYCSNVTVRCYCFVPYSAVLSDCLPVFFHALDPLVAVPSNCLHMQRQWYAIFSPSELPMSCHYVILKHQDTLLQPSIEHCLCPMQCPPYLCNAYHCPRVLFLSTVPPLAFLPVQCTRRSES